MDKTIMKTGVFLCWVIAVKQLAKQYHYEVKGESFDSDHRFFDEIYEACLYFENKINEVVFMGVFKNSRLAGTAKAQLAKASDILSQLNTAVSNKERAFNLKTIMEKSLSLIAGATTDRAVNVVYDEIYVEFTKYIGLLSSRTGE